MRRDVVVVVVPFAVALLVTSGLWGRSKRTVDWLNFGKIPGVERGATVWSADGAVAISLTTPMGPGMSYVEAHTSFPFDPEQHRWRVQQSTYERRGEFFGFGGMSVSRIRVSPTAPPTSITETLLLTYPALCGAWFALGAVCGLVVWWWRRGPSDLGTERAASPAKD